MPYLLRVELPDVPGSLGRVASAIGEAGGDIEAIEIVEHRGEGTAVDDVLLEMAHGVMPDSVVSACNQLDGVHVLWISRYAAGGSSSSTSRSSSSSPRARRGPTTPSSTCSRSPSAPTGPCG